MDDRTIIDACAYLGLVTGETQDPARVALYAEALRDLKNEDHFAKAISLLRDRCEHFPKIPEIRETYREVLANTPSSSVAIDQFVPMTPAEREALAVEMRAFWEEKWGTDMGPASEQGSCADCGERGDVWTVGARLFCRRCASSRRKVAARVDITELLREMPA